MKRKIIELIKDLFTDTLGAALYAAGIYSFAVAGNFAPGGISGLSIIVHHYFEFIPIGLCTLAFNVPIIIITYKALGKRFLAKSLLAMVIMAVMMDFVFPMLPTYKGDQLLAAIFAGALAGIGLSLIYMRGSSTGGTDFVIMSLRKKYPHMSIGNITLIIDGCIILLNGVAFGRIEAVLYGAVLTYTTTIFIDKLMYRVGSRKEVNIITTKGKELSKEINDKVGRGATIINAVGTHTNTEKQLLVCICDSRQAIKVRTLAYKVDKDSLIYISTSDEVYGCGFLSNEQKN